MINSQSPQDNGVHDDLKDVLKMIAVTLIMDHTIDLEPRHRDTILSQLFTHRSFSEYPKETSPWMVSMQLKHFFSAIRDRAYQANLERLQSILHSSKSANPRLSALLHVLGFALALEECQYTTLMQAEGRVMRREEAEWPSWKRARDQCDGVDAAFELVRNLFHCRYSAGKNRQHADLNEWVKKSQGAVEKEFLVGLLALFDRNREYIALLCG